MLRLYSCCQKNPFRNSKHVSSIHTLSCVRSTSGSLDRARNAIFQREVLIVRKNEACALRASVSDEDVVRFSGDTSVHMRDLGLLHTQTGRQRMDLIVRYAEPSFKFLC